MNVIMQNISYCAYMNKIIENLKKYILEVLDLQINPKPIALTDLPIFFKNSYFAIFGTKKLQTKKLILNIVPYNCFSL